MNLVDRITHLSPCTEAKSWLATQTDPVAAWQNCRRGDWMLWLLGSLNHSAPWSDGRKPLLACALDSAETVRHLWSESQRDKMAAAIAKLREWVSGAASAEEARAARKTLRDCRHTAAAATYAAAAAAAYADADAADAADAYAAAYAADAYAAAYAADAYAAARSKSLSQCADIVRQHFPQPPEVREP